MKRSNRKPAAEPQPKKTGRPPNLLADGRTLRMIRKLAEIQCTQQEAASVLGVHKDTFNDFLRSPTDKRAADAWEMGREEGKVALRRLQWRTAQKSTTMQIWLGKQWLNQRDKMDETVQATVSSAVVDVSVLEEEPPNYEAIGDKQQQLKAFLEFRRRLALSYVPPAKKQN